MLLVFLFFGSCFQSACGALFDVEAASSIPLEQGYGFDVSGLREHIQRHGAL